MASDLEGDGICVLFVDDNLELLRIARLSLGRLGYEVTLAENGRDALFKADRKSFQVAVVDMLMPNMGGVATMLELRKRLPDLTIVAISGGPGYPRGAHNLRVAESVGADVSLAKPFSSLNLHQAIQTALAKTAQRPLPLRAAQLESVSRMQPLVQADRSGRRSSVELRNGAIVRAGPVRS